MEKKMHDILSRFSRSKAREKREKAMQQSLINDVNVNGNGTSGYTLKKGPNKGKILKHLKVKHPNNI
tara:strand:- start:3407 stop:3607 length:201 start_codon:yes stop_codon:yes gene_type:complete